MKERINVATSRDAWFITQIYYDEKICVKFQYREQKRTLRAKKSSETTIAKILIPWIPIVILKMIAFMNLQTNSNTIISYIKNIRLKPNRLNPIIFLDYFES